MARHGAIFFLVNDILRMGLNDVVVRIPMFSRLLETVWVMFVGKISEKNGNMKKLGLDYFDHLDFAISSMPQTPQTARDLQHGCSML